MQFLASLLVGTELVFSVPALSLPSSFRLVYVMDSRSRASRPTRAVAQVRRVHSFVTIGNVAVTECASALANTLARLWPNCRPQGRARELEVT